MVCFAVQKWWNSVQPQNTIRVMLQLVMKISRKKLNRKIFHKIFPFFIRTVDMVSLFTFYTVIIMLIYISPFILIGR
jgi:hypothetical protein